MRRLIAAFFSIILFVSSALGQEISWHATGKNGAVCAGGAEAVAAGLDALKKGGNAFDGLIQRGWCSHLGIQRFRVLPYSFDKFATAEDSFIVGLIILLTGKF